MKKLLKLLDSYQLKSIKVTSLVVKRRKILGGEVAFQPDCKHHDVTSIQYI